MKKKIEISFFCTFLFLVGVANAINIPAGECVNLTLFNSTSNSAYTETICALHDVYNETIILNSGESYTDDYGNLTITCNQTGVFCPGCPEQLLCIDQQIFTPTENVTHYENYRGVCRINITIENTTFGQCQLPADHVIMPIGEVAELELEAKESKDCCLRTGNLSTELNDCQDSLKECTSYSSRSFCAIDDNLLMNNYKKLSDKEEEWLRTFAHFNYYITSFELAETIAGNKEMTDNEFDSLYYNVDKALKKFEKLKFAETSVKEVYYSALDSTRNETTYMPNITIGCIDRVPGLIELASEKKWDGVKMSFGIGGGIFAVFCLVWVWKSNKNIMSGR